jgi:hypothetical protein
MVSSILFSIGILTALYAEVTHLDQERSPTMTITITSSAFRHTELIPSKYTCDGEDISPPLSWDSIPSNAKSLVLISDDPDAPMGTWVHWVVYNIPPTAGSFEENVPAVERLEDGTVQGKNNFGKIGYGGPCPPGGTHRYFFKMYALDTVLEFKPGATKKEIVDAMENHVVGQGELIGTYTR